MNSIRHIIVIGAGIGGLAAALRLAQRGHRVSLFEARAAAGGLASGLEFDGLKFDGGPYVLLDRPGLEWALTQLGFVLDESLALRRLEDVYEVTSENDPCVRFSGSLDVTADRLERTWAGSGQRYRAFITQTGGIYDRLAPLQRVSRPSVRAILHTGAWRHVPFLVRPLGSILRRTSLPAPVCRAIGIWTHVAGQSLESAPSPLAFVPSVIHRHGAWFLRDGIASIPALLHRAATQAGVEFHFAAPIRSIRCDSGQVRGVEAESGELIGADAVLSNVGIGTYLKLLGQANRSPLPPATRRELSELPLQSPGVCVYLAIRKAPQPPYLRFYLPGGNELCRLLVQPGVPVPECVRDGWWPARLIAPMRHDQAEAGGVAAQREYLARVLEEPWWREQVGEYRVVATQIPAEWGSQFHLYRDSMNPVMTASFMRRGRLAHRSPHVRGLYLAGSATHPGQWVSFCAISGILAVDRICEDLR